MKKIILVLYIGIILLFTGCPDKGPVKIDPCAGTHPVKADFDIFEQLFDDSLFVADTVLQGNVIHFIAKGVYDHYEWKIGSDDSIFVSKEVRLRFYEPYNNLTIRLIVRSKPLIECFPDDDGIDTIEKKLTVVNYLGGSGLLGHYIGCNLESTLDTFIVTIGFKDVYIDGKYNHSYYYVNNINKGCNEPRPDSTLSLNNYLIGYRCIKIIGDGYDSLGCKLPIGYGYLDENHEYIIFRYTIGWKKEQHFTFIGRKI